MNLKVSNIDLNNLVCYENAIIRLLPEAKANGLTGYLLYKKDSNKLSLITKNNLSIVEVGINATMEPSEVLSDFSLLINVDTFFYVLKSYDDTKKKEMVFEIGQEDSSYFKVKTTNDNLSLPHLFSSNAETLDLIEDSTFTLGVNHALTINSEEKDLISGIEESFDYISRDDVENNAIAVYKDKLVVNDPRHVFQYGVSTNVNSGYVAIHKIPAKILQVLKSIPYKARLSEDFSSLMIIASNFVAKINNSMSNIAPPNEEELSGIRPQNLIFETTVGTLKNTLTFFSGFYTSKTEYRTIIVKPSKEGIMFTLKDSGISGFNSCNIERLLPVDVKFECNEATVIIDSVLSILKGSLDTDVISVYMDNDSPSVYMHTDKRDIYLAKLRSR